MELEAEEECLWEIISLKSFNKLDFNTIANIEG